PRTGSTGMSAPAPSSPLTFADALFPCVKSDGRGGQREPVIVAKARKGESAKGKRHLAAKTRRTQRHDRRRGKLAMRAAFAITIRPYLWLPCAFAVHPFRAFVLSCFRDKNATHNLPCLPAPQRQELRNEAAQEQGGLLPLADRRAATQDVAAALLDQP